MWCILSGGHTKVFYCYYFRWLWLSFFPGFFFKAFCHLGLFIIDLLAQKKLKIKNMVFGAELCLFTVKVSHTAFETRSLFIFVKLSVKYSSKKYKYLISTAY